MASSGGKDTVKGKMEKNAKNTSGNSKAVLKQNKEIIEALEKYKVQIRKKYGKDYKKLTEEEAIAAATRFGAVSRKQLKEAAAEIGKTLGEVLDEQGVGTAAKISSVIGNGLNKVLNTTFVNNINSGISSYMGMYDEHLSSIATRLIGLGNGTRDVYDDILNNVDKMVGLSPYTTTYTVISNLSNYVQKGILNNIEQRAFLASVSDRIATTFDAFDGSLTTLIKLNREDSTEAYLGLEAALTEFLNTSYMDSSYMTDMSKNVRASLLESVALLGTQQGAEFQFMVEKWLGSFYSSGASGNFINSLAQSINALATGDVDKLTSNESMNSLFAYAANKAGLNYGSLLTNGVDATSVNKLLQGIYSVASEIAVSTNNVEKQQLGDKFGLGIQDLIAIEQINSNQLQSLVKTGLSYGQLLSKLDYELDNVIKRTGMKTMVDNFLQNVLAGVGNNIATNPAAYATWTVADLIGDVEVNVPFLGAVNLTKAVKSGIMGISLISEVIGSLGSLFNGTLFGDMNTPSVIKSTGTGMITGVGNYSTQQGISKSTNSVVYVASDTQTGTSNLLSDSLSGNKEVNEVVAENANAPDTQDTLESVRDNTKDIFELLKLVLGDGTSSGTVLSLLSSLVSLYSARFNTPNLGGDKDTDKTNTPTNPDTRVEYTIGDVIDILEDIKDLMPSEDIMRDN